MLTPLHNFTMHGFSLIEEGKMLRHKKIILRQIIKNLFISIMCLSFCSIQACSLSSYATGEGLIAGIAGSVVGGGLGNLFGDKYGKKTENTAIGAGIGAASGLALGALLHENRQEVSKEKAQIVRVSKEISSRQKEIDTLREEVYSESSWGGNETNPWSSRYQIETSDLPYQSLSLE